MNTYCICLCYLFLLTMATEQVVLGKVDEQNKSYDEEMGDESSLKNLTSLRVNNESAVEEGPPDSHEAMNNREIGLKRDKRSYHFLMGLIKNNSIYEQITKEETTTSSPEIPPGEVGASEMLLELLVKIASDPGTWEKVHNLLGKIDGDLVASKKIIDSLAKHSSFTPSEAPISVTKKPHYDWRNYTRFNYWSDHKWSTEPTTEPAPTTPRYKNFLKSLAYQRVTGRPLYLNKTPKAYIALSVIAPKKPTRSQHLDEDVTLEKELRQLKPWTHSQNLKNMADLRAKWVIQGDDKKQGLS